MADFPSDNPTGLPLFVHTHSRFSDTARFITSALTSITSPAASRAIYVPIWLPFAYPVRRVFWINGSSVASVNADFGIYSPGGECIYTTGGTACSGASAVQYVTPANPFLLPPGKYYFAKVVDSSTANRGGFGQTALTRQVNYQRICGNYQQASAYPLPTTTITPAAVAAAYFPCCGITRTASGF